MDQPFMLLFNLCGNLTVGIIHSYSYLLFLKIDLLADIFKSYGSFWICRT